MWPGQRQGRGDVFQPASILVVRQIRPRPLFPRATRSRWPSAGTLPNRFKFTSSHQNCTSGSGYLPRAAPQAPRERQAASGALPKSFLGQHRANRLNEPTRRLLASAQNTPARYNQILQEAPFVAHAVGVQCLSVVPLNFSGLRINLQASFLPDREPFQSGTGNPASAMLSCVSFQPVASRSLAVVGFCSLLILFPFFLLA
jgi:hypothetical protein